MADEAALAAWQASQQERKAQREKWAHEAKEREVAQALKVLAKHGHPAPGDVERLKQEHEALKTAHQVAQDELTAARLVVDQDWQVEQIGELKQGLRDRDWRDAWRETAREAGMHEKAIDHAWNHYGLKPETDEPDRKILQRLCADLRQEYDYFWPSAPAPTPESQPEAWESQPSAPAGSGRRFVFQDGGWRSNGAN